MKKEFCCESMKYHIEYKCDVHKDPFDCPDKIIYHSKKHNNFGIMIHDGGSSFIEIEFCPWCDKKFENK